MQYRKLGATGLKVSVLGFGAASLGDVYQKVEEKEGIRAVHAAVDAGINLFDVAPLYGYTRAEAVLGKALQSVPRDKIVLATKAGRYGQDNFDFSPARIRSSLEESLQRLNTDYADIFHLHDVEFTPLGPLIHESIPTLRKLKEEGKIRYYGIAGLPLRIFTEVAGQMHLDTILSYCRYSLNDNSLLKIIPFLQQRNIGIINASPLSMGLLTMRGVPSWHPATAEIREVCRMAAELCQRGGADIAKLAVQWSVSNPDIPTTLVGTANPNKIIRNVQWVEEPIDRQLLQRVLDILKPVQNRTWPSGLPENND